MVWLCSLGLGLIMADSRLLSGLSTDFSGLV